MEKPVNISKFVIAPPVFTRRTSFVTASSKPNLPCFSAARNSSDNSISVEGGVNVSPAPNSIYGTVALSTYVDSSTQNAVGYTVSGSGTNALYHTAEPYMVPTVNCNASTPSTCAVAVRLFQGVIYMAYSDASSGTLDVITATPIANNVGYTLSQVYHDSTGIGLVTAPEMEVINGRLVIVYGSNADSRTKNAFYSVTYDGTTFTNPSEQHLGIAGIASASKPGLAVLGTNLWMCLQQNNNNHQLFTYYTSDGITWNFGAQVSSLAMGSGGSMVTYNNSLVLATAQNNSNHSLFIFSSVDGIHWGAQQYTNLLYSYDAGIGLLNGGVALGFKSKTSANYFSTFASH